MRTFIIRLLLVSVSMIAATLQAQNITFNHLTEENFLGIADIMLKELQESLSTRGLTLSWDDDLRQLLVKKADRGSHISWR